MSGPRSSASFWPNPLTRTSRALAWLGIFGLVVPQQSPPKPIQKVFRKTPGLRADMVMTAFEAGESDEHFDLLLVDESRRLNQRANQASAAQNTKFRTITEKLFGRDDTSKTQLDWIRDKSSHQILFMDAAQSVRPADLPRRVLSKARAGGHLGKGVVGTSERRKPVR